MEFIAANKEDFKLHGSFLTLQTWKITKINFDFDFQEISETVIEKILINNRVVAFIEYSYGVYNDNTISIDNFEVLEKGNGFGSKIITFLKKDLSNWVLELYSYSEESNRFWEKNGFIKYDDGTGTNIYRFNQPN